MFLFDRVELTHHRCFCLGNGHIKKYGNGSDVKSLLGQ
jgi:hypothetical protein